MGRFRWRRLLIAAGVLIALPALLLAVTAALVPHEKLAGEVAARVAAATGAEVVPGTVSLKVVGGLGLTLSDGRLSGTGAELRRRTGSGQNIGNYDLAYSRLEVSLGLWPLLRRRLEVETVRLTGPELLVEVDGDPVRLRIYDILVTDLRLDLAAPETPSDGEEPGLRIPAKLSFGLRAQAAEMIQRGTPWQAVRLTGAWAARRLQISGLTAALGDGRVIADGTLDYRDNPWGSLSWTARLEDLPAGTLLTPYLPDLGSKLVCALAGEVTGSMVLKDAATRRRSLTLNGQVTAGEGVLYAEEWLRDVSRYLGRRQDLKTVHFSRLTHRFAVLDGRYLIDVLEIDGHQTDWQANGWLGFDGGIGLTVGVRLPAGFTPDLGSMSFLAETMRDGEGRVRLGLKLSGRAAAPTIGLDFAALGRSR